MLRRLAKWITVLSLVFTMGGHWAFLQTVAWVGMAVSYSQEDGFSTALVKTFDGRNPCKLCKFVSEGKKAEKKSEAQLTIKKLDSFTHDALAIYFPRLTQTSARPVWPLLSYNEVPPTPPPIA